MKNNLQMLLLLLFITACADSEPFEPIDIFKDEMITVDSIEYVEDYPSQEKYVDK